MAEVTHPGLLIDRLSTCEPTATSSSLGLRFTVQQCFTWHTTLFPGLVSLNLSPNLQQFFERDSVSLSCVEDGQTVDGTVKRTRGGQTEDCGAPGSSFGNFTGSSCIISELLQSDSGVYWCETSSGRSRDQINFTVSGGELILEIPALPVLTGSDVTLRCRNRNGETVAAYFFKNNFSYDGSKSEFILSRVQPFDEGLYSCSTDTLGESPQSWLRVRDPPPTTSAPPSTTLCSSTLTSPVNSNSSTPPSSSPPSVFRLFFLPGVKIFFICFCSALMVLICCRMKTVNKPVVSMETTQCVEEYDDITADVTTEHDLRADGAAQ
ncbi:low affinity immunoglobulin gamma Fc region receptor III-like [Anabas testudineus]|uniref:low affinity immunoglobulin gamma Fc region receptor III-like n=1 Tax=Anabas testudineus TaxID=64144 RepID=UPI00143D224F|nr:low affinity immunoglobulin gamma Fc region receptor III-like [Anabas testudineus]